MLKKFFDWFTRDNHGNLVIWQRPNFPLGLWLVLSVTNHFAHTKHVHNGIRIGASIALLYWAAQEVISGASYFRRTLGVVVLVVSLLSLIKLLF